MMGCPVQIDCGQDTHTHNIGSLESLTLACRSIFLSFIKDFPGIPSSNLEDEFDSSTEIGEYTWTVTHQKLLRPSGRKGVGRGYIRT